MRINRRCLPLILTSLATVSLGVAADDDRSDSPKDIQRNMKLRKIYQDHAASYQMELVESQVKLKLKKDSIFTWLNPARVGTPRTQHGGVFVWTHRGRAEVIGTVFSQTVGDKSPVLYHEFHSLATEPVKARNQTGNHWNTNENGLEPKPFPNAEPPARKRNLRMAQMRRLARRFNGYSINYDQKRWALRLLPQPLHRTLDGHPEVLDGAVFTLVSTAGTDPEALVLIEARKREGDWRWHYSVCRFTDLKTWVRLDDKVVWSFENGTRGPFIDSGPNRRYRFSSEGTIFIPGD